MKKIYQMALALGIYSMLSMPVNAKTISSESLPCYSSQINYRNQELANQYIQDGMYNFWHGDEIKANESMVFKGITLRGKLGVVEYDFAKAVELDPSRLDIQFDLASTQILQNKTAAALDSYQKILAQDPRNFNALILAGAYSKISGATESAQQFFARAQTLDPRRAKQMQAILDMTEQNFKLALNPQPAPINGKLAIVVLGYALAADGTPQSTLIERLKVALAEYKLNPQTAIIVSGGMPRGGVTESYIMKQWLIKHGVPAEQIYIEDQSKDTVMNAVYSLAIVQKLAVDKVVLISSASHMRRAYSVFSALEMQKGTKLKIDNLVYLDYPDLAQAMAVTTAEKLVIVRDVLRAAGIWAYPGIQQ